jgi:hypothetical protein
MTDQVNNYSEELAKYATETTASLPSVGGEFISTSGGRLSYKGVAVPGDQMDVVVLDFIHVNMLYEGTYDANNPTSPVCYSMGHDIKTMAPHEQCAKPQAAMCKDCPMNQFKSAANGVGKACQNTLRLGLMPVGALENIEHEDMACIKVPVMSVKNFTSYAQQIAQTLKRPPFGMVTRLARVPDKNSQFRLTFEAVEYLDGAVIGAVMEKRKAIKLDFAFPESPVTEAKPAARTTSRFSGARKL